MATSHKTVTFPEVEHRKPEVLLVDVREPAELQQTGILPNSINIPLGKVQEAFQNLTADEFHAQYGCPKPVASQAIIFSCKAGIRSAKAMKVVEGLGYANASNYMGGWDDWEEQIKQKRQK